MEIRHLEDRDLLYMLQVVIKNGNLFELVNEHSGYKSFEHIEAGISWLLQNGIIMRALDGYEITPHGSEWRRSVWRKLGIKGIYRYLNPSGQAPGSSTSLDDPFLPKKFNFKKD